MNRPTQKRLNIQSPLRIGSLIVLGATFMSVVQDLAAQSVAHIVPTNLPGVYAATDPPEWFNPLTASNDDLAAYGLPPRPDSGTQPGSYRSWQRAISHPKRTIVPELKLTAVLHGPAQATTVQDSTAGSYNWSAVVVDSGATSYNQNTSFYYVNAEYVVPVATQAFGVCSGWDYSSSWVGIDGFNSNDVLQAGTSSDAYCGGSVKSQVYYAWYEWFPLGSVQINGFAVSPGDDIFVEVWNTSATQGYAYILNYNTNLAVNLAFTAPAGTVLMGNVAEWVVERPTVNGNLATLTNYISDYFSSCGAETHGGSGYTPGSASAIDVTMYSGSAAISSPTVLGPTSIQFTNEGPSR